MYRVWYWAMVDRETDGRFIASIPDLGDLAAYGENEKDAVARLMSRVPWHLFKDRQPRAHLVVGALVRTNRSAVTS